MKKILIINAFVVFALGAHSLLAEHTEPRGCPHLHTYLYKWTGNDLEPLKDAYDRVLNYDYFSRTYFSGSRCLSVTEAMDIFSPVTDFLVYHIPHVSDKIYFTIGQTDRMRLKHQFPEISSIPLISEFPLVKIRFNDDAFMPRPGELVNLDAAQYHYVQHKNEMNNLIEHGSNYCGEKVLVCSADNNPYGEKAHYTGIIYPQTMTSLIPHRCDVSASAKELADNYCASRKKGTSYFLDVARGH